MLDTNPLKLGVSSFKSLGLCYSPLLHSFHKFAECRKSIPFLNRKDRVGPKESCVTPLLRVPAPDRSGAPVLCGLPAGLSIRDGGDCCCFGRSIAAVFAEGR